MKVLIQKIKKNRKLAAFGLFFTAACGYTVFMEILGCCRIIHRPACTGHTLWIKKEKSRIMLTNPWENVYIKDM